MARTKVSITKGKESPSEQEIEGLVREALSLLGNLDDLIAPGKNVLIKPNNADVWDIPEEVTDVRVVKAVAKIVKEKGATPVIAESSAVAMDTEKVYEMTGYYQLRDEGYELVDLKKTEVVKLPLVNGKEFKALSVFKMVRDADTIISVPMLKTHVQLLVTLSIKNMKGCLPDFEKRKAHLVYGVEEAIAQLNTLVRPHLTVVDGIYGGGGRGSPYRTFEEVDVIVAGRDPVAVDTVCSQVMGVDPQEVLHLKYAEELGVGTMNPDEIEVVGQSIAEVYHRFVTSWEATEDISQRLGVKLALDESTCTGCNVGIMGALRGIEAMGRADDLKGLTIAAGRGMERLPDVEKEKLILVGNCIKALGDRGRHVPGCPMSGGEMVTEVTGVELSETPMGDAVEAAYASYQKKVAAGSPKGYDWNARPRRKG